uniref:uncharacterized protein LOC101293586 n=1 Tax=Fragaria vesca subsp. vesca TaxID=101020 RepID=UPI0005C88FAD|nr:PREDICTED: uncharacterized protein LOC101293586 [Fragaria vesca subsp. vesca]
MDMVKGNSRKKNQTKKPSRPCSNLLKQASKVCAALSSLTKRKSWSCSTSTCSRKKNKAGRAAPAGCFPAYVGPEKQQFVVKTEIANHPLFKVLLEDAAWEYGYSTGGPILLPCDVDLFCNVLAEMENNVDGDMMSLSDEFFFIQCSSPARRPRSDSSMIKGYDGAYMLLSPSVG